MSSRDDVALIDQGTPTGVSDRRVVVPPEERRLPRLLAKTRFLPVEDPLLTNICQAAF